MLFRILFLIYSINFKGNLDNENHLGKTSHHKSRAYTNELNDQWKSNKSANRNQDNVSF